MIWFLRKNLLRKNCLNHKLCTCSYNLEDELCFYYLVLSPYFLWVGQCKSQVSAVKGLNCPWIGNRDEFLCSFESISTASHSIFTRTTEMQLRGLLLSTGLQRIKYWSTCMWPLSSTSYCLHLWEDGQQLSLLCPCPFTFFFPWGRPRVPLSVYSGCSLGTFSSNPPSKMLSSVYWVS